MKWFLLVVLATTTTASEPLLGASRHLWPGGEADIATVTGWLSQHGNQTEIALPAQTRARLDFTAGTYWEAIVATCRAFDLVVAEPRQHRRLFERFGDSDNHRRTLALDTGPVVLEPRTGSRAGRRPVACGPLLLTIHDAALLVSERRWPPDPAPLQARARVLYRLRCEPRVADPDLAPALIEWLQARTADGRLAAWAPAGAPLAPPPMPIRTSPGNLVRSPPRPAILRCYELPPAATGLRLEGVVTATVLAPVKAQAPVALGLGGRIAVGDEEWAWTLHEAGGPGGAWSSLVVEVPEGSRLHDRPQVRLIDAHGGAVMVHRRRTTSRQVQLDLTAPPGGALTLEVEAATIAGQPRIPIAATVNWHQPGPG